MASFALLVLLSLRSLLLRPGVDPWKRSALTFSREQINTSSRRLGNWGGSCRYGPGVNCFGRGIGAGILSLLCAEYATLDSVALRRGRRVEVFAMFSSFMEKRNLQNKIYDEMIEDAKREEEEKRRKQESRWGCEWRGNLSPWQYSETEQALLSELRDRALVSLDMPSVYSDKAALAICRQLGMLGKGRSKTGKWVLSSLANARYMTEIRSYLLRYPKATIVNIGNDLSTLFYRVNNKQLTWCNIADESVLDMRNRLAIDDFPNVHQICADPEDLSWFDRVPRNEKTGLVILADTAIRAWNPSNVKSMLLTLNQKYPGSLLLMNCSGGKAGNGKDAFTFYSLNAGDAIRSWLDGPRSRVYAYSYPDKTLLETLDGASRYRMKALHRAGNQILTIVKM